MDLSSLIHNQLLGLINSAITVLSGAAVVVFFWGLVNYIREAEDTHAHNHGKELIMWGLVSLFILFGVWGILNVFQQSLFGSVGNGQGANTSTYLGASQTQGGMNGVPYTPIQQ